MGGKAIAGVTELAGREAVVELSDELVEQVPQGRDVVVAEASTALVVGAGAGVAADGGQRPDVTGGGNPVVLGSACTDPVRPAG